MLVDDRLLGWMRKGGVLTVVSFTLFAIYLLLSESNVPRGGTWQGMLFGIAGSVCMLFAGLLSGKKAVPKRQTYSSQEWLRGHIWIGLLSVPLILFHCNFRCGGLLEQLLLATFAIVILSGVYGLLLQQILPRKMTTASPAQAIAAQVPVVCERLRNSIEPMVEKACGAIFLESVTSLGVSLPSTAKGNSPEREEPPEATFGPRELAGFYWSDIYTFLDPTATLNHRLADAARADKAFRLMKDRSSSGLVTVIEAVQRACDERRQLLSQARIHAWLHGWLCLHVPLSIVLFVLGALHAVMSVYY